MSSSKQAYKELLGPIFNEFCFKMELFIESYKKEDPVVLFQARGGLRLRYLYEVYLNKKNIKSDIELKDFFVSRLAVMKGCLYKDVDYIAGKLCGEFRYNTFAEMLKAIVKHEDIINQLDHEFLLKRVTVEDFTQILKSDTLNGEGLRNYFIRQKELFEEYLQQETSGRNTVILVDTGWGASTQEILMKVFPEINWVGLYFGKWDYHNTNPWHFYNVFGLGINKSILTRKYPNSALYFYHHLIEDPLEPSIPSTEEYIKDEDGKIKANFKLDLNKVKPQQDDFMYSAIVDYVSERANESLVNINRSAKKAYRRLFMKINFPSRKDVQILLVRPRSADFGRALKVPVLIDAKGHKIKGKLENVRHSLWRQAQIAMEFGVVYRVVQLAFYYKMKKRKFIRP